MKQLLLLFVFLALAFSCGKKEDDDSSSGSSLGKGGTILTNGEKAFDTTGSEVSTASFIEAATTNSFVHGLSSDSCSPAGSGGDAPDSFNNGLNYVVCLFDTNSKSPDTFQGALWLGKTIMTETEKSITYQYNTTETLHESISVTVGSDTLTISLKEKALASSDFWDYRIDIDRNNATFTNRTHTLWLKDSDGKFGAKLYELDTAGTQGSDDNAWILLVDTSNDEIRYENWDNSNGRHTRLYAKGTIATDGTVSALTDIGLVHSDGSVTVNSSQGLLMANSHDGTNRRVDSILDGSTSAVGVCNDGSGGSCESNPTFNSAFYNHSTEIDTSSLDSDTSGELTFTRSTFDLSQAIQ